MSVFVTGETVFSGSAIVQALLSAGHQALSLARTEKSAKLLAMIRATISKQRRHS